MHELDAIHMNVSVCNNTLNPCDQHAAPSSWISLQIALLPQLTLRCDLGNKGQGLRGIAQSPAGVWMKAELGRNEREALPREVGEGIKKQRLRGIVQSPPGVWMEAEWGRNENEALPRVELGLVDSESTVITTTLQRRTWQYTGE